MTITSLPTTGTIIPQFTLGDRLRKAREIAGLQMTELWGLIGVHRQTIAKYESNTAIPRPHVVIAWALATGVDREWLLTGCTPGDSNSEPTDSGFSSIEGTSGYIFASQRLAEIVR